MEIVVVIIGRNSEAAQKALTRWPNRTCRIKGLNFDANEISYLPISRGDKEVINTATGNRDLRNEMKFVSRFVGRE